MRHVTDAVADNMRIVDKAMNVLEKKEISIKNWRVIPCPILIGNKPVPVRRMYRQSRDAGDQQRLIESNLRKPPLWRFQGIIG